MPKRKRGNAEGSIYKMKDGRWRAAVSVGKDADGKSKRRIFTANTRHEVAEELTAALRDRDRGINIKPGKLTVGQFLADWLENTVRPSTRPKTYTSYEQQVRNHISKTVPPEEWKEKELDAVPGFKDVRLSKLTLQQVQKFLNDKLKAGNSPSQVKYLRVVLRTALNQALKADLIARNVAELATPPKAEKREITPFTEAQAGRFLMAAMGHRNEALFTVGLAVGLRSGECSALRWENVNLETGTVIVKHTLQRIKEKGLVLEPPKSEKSRRTVELPASCIATLQAHRERQQKERELAGSRWKETGYVFTSTIGTPIDATKILKEFNALVEAAGLPKQRFHDLRHACVSLLRAMGESDKVIAEIVGHSDIRLTQNVYQHVYQEAKVEAAAKMDAFLTRAKENPVATKVATKPVSTPLN
jgi:integrase